MLVLAYTLPGNVWKFQVHWVFTSICCYWSFLFAWSFSWVCTVSHCSSLILTTSLTFSFACWLFSYLPWCSVCSNPFYINYFCLFVINWWCFFIFCLEALCQINVLWICSPISGLPIHFLNSICWWVVVLNFD